MKIIISPNVDQHLQSAENGSNHNNCVCALYSSLKMYRYYLLIKKLDTNFRVSTV